MSDPRLEQEPTLEEVLEALRVNYENERKAAVKHSELNAKVILAALDSMLQPWTLHEKAHLHVLLRNIKKLRAHVAQYVDGE